MLQDELDELCEELQAVRLKKGHEWEGFDVYEPVYEKFSTTGYPYVVLVKDDEARICTPEESLAYLDYKLSIKKKRKKEN